MKAKVFQINMERDKNDVKFRGFGELPKLQNSVFVDASLYDEVFNGKLDCENVEDTFFMLNSPIHPLFRGHSLSVSDVVVNDKGAFYCDTFGFKQIDFDTALTQKPDNLMTVVYVEPNKQPYVAEIEHTLEAEQRAVGGLIEAVYNDDGTCLICNEEAKLIGMEGNRRIGDGSSIIAGPFFVVGLTADDFRSLTESEVTKYMDRFAEPENISQTEVDADTGFTLYTGM